MTTATTPTHVVFHRICTWKKEGYDINLCPVEDWDYHSQHAYDKDSVRFAAYITVPTIDPRFLAEQGLARIAQERDTAIKDYHEQLAKLRDYEAKYLCLAAPQEIVA